MTDKNDNWQYACENFGAVQSDLAKKDIVADPRQVYRGPDVAEMFQTSEDVAQMRVGRKSFKGHEHFKFNDSLKKGSMIPGFMCNSYSVFIPLTRENIGAIREGRPFQYVVAEDFEEDNEGFIERLNSERLPTYTGRLEGLISLMPKRKIPGLDSTNVRIGSRVVEKVTSSNADDEGDVIIRSLSGDSFVSYNPSREDPPRPYFQSGPIGWKEPLEVKVKGDQLFFDERQQPDGELWLLKFQREGYDPIPL